MKLLSFSRGGRAGFGAVSGDGIVDLGAALGGRYADLKALLAADAVAEAAAAVAQRKPDFTLADVTLLPVIPDPGKIWCCGLNYHEHVQETNREVTEKPMFFLRVADSQVGHGQAIVRPTESTQLDYEAEIAVIIGKGGRRIPEADAGKHVAGYACYNDGSVRDWQLATSQWTPGKNFHRTGGFGPWLVTADEIPDPSALSYKFWVNDELRGERSFADLTGSPAQMIAFASTAMTLYPGDIVMSGAADVAPVVPGDVMKLEIPRIGRIEVPVSLSPYARTKPWGA